MSYNIAVAGKGGTGKTSLTGLLIDILLKENLLTDSKTLKKYIKETKNLKEELILSS